MAWRKPSADGELRQMLRVAMLGRTQLWYQGESTASKISPSALSALAYLLLHRDAVHRRSAVAFTLWPDEPESEALSRLRRFLFELQNALPRDVTVPWILADKITIQWNPEAPLWLDVDEFEQSARDPAEVAAAVDLYAGDLLPHLTDDWLASTRARLADLYESILFGLMSRERVRGDPRAALRYAMLLLARDPLREDVVRAVVELRNALGNRAGALRSYRDFAERLWSEMHVEPLPETRAAYDLVVHPTPRVESISGNIDDVDDEGLEELWTRLHPSLIELNTLEEVARRLTDALYEQFASSVVLARVFATVEARQLPAADRAFVERFVASLGGKHELSATTPILSLLATRGIEDAWNDRRRSRDHLAIPLLSGRQVAEMPMIATLLKEIGFPSEWRGSTSSYTTMTLANINGIFYVANARTAVDGLGRRIIPATAFVEKHAVSTVFGFGGSFTGRHMFIAAVLFCRHEIARSQAMRFVPLIESFKNATRRLVNQNAIFSAKGSEGGR